MKKILPEKLTGFSKAVADLFLLHDGTPEWVAEPKVREAWHWLFLSIVSFGFLLIIVRPFFAAVFPRIYDTSETFALIDDCLGSFSSWHDRIARPVGICSFLLSDSHRKRS